MDKTKSRISQWLREKLSELLSIPVNKINDREKFSNYGLTSSKATFLASEMHEAFGKKYLPTIFFAYPTLYELVEHIVNPVVTTSKKSKEKINEEPIAIIGMACRFPKANDVKEFWKFLMVGGDAITEVPSDRWDMDQYYDPDPTAEGKTNTRYGAFLEGDLNEFDPFFFDISPREAIEMNPAQKLTLEIVWEALENAGIPYKNLEGSQTGIFMGSVWNDFDRMRVKKNAQINQHSAVGQSLNIIANRVSYAFGFQGPSIVVDSACSSSLLSIHLACQSLNSGDSDLAIAGGINLMQDPETYVALSKFGGLCPDGKCKTFDEKANGYVRGEGLGVVVLKRLSEAKRDGDKILALVKGSAVNNDGYSNGLTAPNLEAQKAVLKQAYERAGISPQSVNYIEAHGTGTKLGDPIEVEALASVLTAERKETEPLKVGSVKTNIGHLEGAAGIAGIIKSILILQNQVIPKSINFDTANPFIPFDDYNIKVQAENEPIKLSKYKKFRIGISGFGWGGTNCHVVLEEYPEESNELFVCSDDTDKGMLNTLNYLKYSLRKQSYSKSLKTLCAEFATLDENNNKQHRIAFKVSSFRELDSKLSDIIASQGEKYYKKVAPKKKKLVYVLSPYGGQYPGMAVKLHKNEKVFRKKLELCDEYFHRLSGWSLIDKLQNVTEAELEDMSVNIPLSFAVQVSLFELFKSWGIQPDFVIGHSMGELAAAHISGILTLEDTVNCVYHYSRLLETTKGEVGMAVVNYPKEMLSAILENYPSIEIAGFNSPNSTNIAGDKPSINRLLKEVNNRGGKAVKINIHVAAHTSKIDPIVEELNQSVEGINCMNSVIPMVSTATGKFVKDGEIDSNYWSYNLRQPVKFVDAVETVLDEDVVFLELSVHPVLRYYLNDIFVSFKKNALALFSLEREKDDSIACQNLLSSLYLEGFDINWPRIYSKYHNSLVSKKSVIQKNEPFLLPISAKADFSLRQYLENYADFFENEIGDSQKEFFDVCCTSAIRRSHFSNRMALVGKNKQEVIEQLRLLIEGDESDLNIQSNKLNQNSKVAFVFSGQGGQWIGMGRELYNKEDVFKDALDECSRVFAKYTDWNLIHELFADEEDSRMEETEIFQPAICAVQIALAELWMSWGVIPDGVVGHSMGEIAAAYLAGSLTLTDAAKIICTRSKLMKAVSGKGAMLVAALTLEEAEELVSPYNEKVSVAVQNTPNSLVIGGDIQIVEHLQELLNQRGVFNRRVNMTEASHTHHMEDVSQQLAEELGSLKMSVSEKYERYSTVLAARVEGVENAATYWASNLRERVRFSETIAQMMQDDYTVFIEVSPHPLLTYPIRDIAKVEDKEVGVVNSMHRKHADQEYIIKNLGELYTHGYNPDWKGFYPSAGMFVEIPPYPWYREHFEIKDNSEEYNPYQQKRPLLGRKISIADSSMNHYWEVNLSTSRFPFLKDHKIKGKNTLPTSCYIEMIHEAVNDLLDGNETFVIGNPRFMERIEIFDEQPIQLQMKVKIMQPELLAFSFFYLDRIAEKWVECASCMVKNLVEEDEIEDAEHIEIDLDSKDRATDILSPDEFYDFFKEIGVNYGNYFRSVSKIVSRDHDLFLKLTPDSRIVTSSGRYGIHPTVMDGCFQALLLAIPEYKKGGEFKVDSIRKVNFLRKPNYGAPIWVHIKTKRHYDEEKKHIIADLILFTDDNQVICTIKRLKLQEYQSKSVVQPLELTSGSVANGVTNEQVAIPTSVAKGVPQKAQKKEKVSVGELDVEDKLRSIVAQTIQASKSRVGVNQDFKSLGIDSLMAVNLKAAVEQGFKLELQMTVFWNYPNIKELAKFLENELGLGKQEEEVQHEGLKTIDEVVESIESYVSSLPEDQLLEELEKELQSI